MYLISINEVKSQYIVICDNSNSMQASWVVKTLQQAIFEYGAPQIINSDQGTKFTSEEYVGYIKGLKTVKLSMKDKGRDNDNQYIERLFRNIKHDKIYLHLPGDGHELFRLCLEFIEFYNTRRGHSSIQGIPPAQRYMQQAA